MLIFSLPPGSGREWLKSLKLHAVLGGCSIPNDLNLKKLWVKIHNSTLLLDFGIPFSLYRMHALVL